MNRTIQITLLAAAGILIVLVIAVIIGNVTKPNDQATVTNTNKRAIANAEALNSILSSGAQKILLAKTDSGLFIADVNSDTVAELTSAWPTAFSNVVGQTGAREGTWYSATNVTLTQNSLTGTTTIGDIEHRITRTGGSDAATALALDSAGQTLAWVTGPTSQQQIVTYDLVNQVETVIYGANETTNYSNVTWSPDGQYLAFADSNQRIIITDKAGAELQTPINLPYTQFNFLQWIETDNLAAVISTTTDNPKPFVPSLIVLNRSGEIIERHDVLEKLGVPRILWSSDAKYFGVYDPWKNYFIIYDRFGVVIQLVPTGLSGKLFAFGWLPGDITPQRNAQQLINLDTVNTNATTNEAVSEFTISAAQWDQFNVTIRAILDQFRVNFETYRFGTTNQGITIEIQVKPAADWPELIAVQTLFQTFANIPDAPTITLALSDTAGHTWRIDEISRATAETVAQQFTKHAIADLFTITAEQPLGYKTPKTDQPKYNYLSDTVFDVTGYYNPVPVLAELNTTQGDQVYYSNPVFSAIIPSAWSIYDLGVNAGEPFQDNDILFSTPATTFTSPSAWQGFAVVVRQYSLPPEITLDQWLLVNRSDSTITDPSFTMTALAKQVTSVGNTHDEYVLYQPGRVLSITMQRDTGLTEEDRQLFQPVVSSLTDQLTFTR